MADISVAKYNESTHLESRENSHAIENTTTDILVIIKETGNILEVFCEGLDKFNTPRVIFPRTTKLILQIL